MANTCFLPSTSDDSSQDHYHSLYDQQDISPPYLHEKYKFSSSDDGSTRDSDLARKKIETESAHFLSDSGSDSDSHSNSPNKWQRLEEYGLDNFPMKNQTEARKGRQPLNKEERAHAKEIKRSEKLERKATRERLRKMKPGECIKSMKVIIDSNMAKYAFLYTAIENALLENRAEFELQPQPIRNSITWSRAGNALIDGEGSENDAVIIWSHEKFYNLVCYNELSAAIQTIKEKLPNKRITLIIYSGSDINPRTEDATTPDVQGLYGAKRKKTTTLNKKRLVEIELVRLQFEHDCSYRMFASIMEVANFLAQFTKAISEIPFRKEKERQEQELAWLAAADSRGCVRVNKSSQGLAQLWTQQLLQFNNCNLDAVNEITKRYPTPQALVQAYERCASEQEAAALLKEIPIVRKCIGDLAAKRKLGPEVSRKLHLLFTCKDPNVQLSNE